MEITAKDILSDENLRIFFCEALARELVEKNFFQDIPTYDDYGCHRGFETVLKPELENQIKEEVTCLVIKEAKKLLEDDYEIGRAIKETIKNYIVSKFEEMVKNANK